VALENVLHGAAEVDASGEYLWLNKIYAELAGCSQTDKPAHIADTVQPEDRARVQKAITQMLRNGRSDTTAHMGPSHGVISEVGMTFLAVAEDPGSSYYVFVSDISAGKKSEAALVRAKDAAEASNRAKTDFLAKISHDIRTPLNAILGSADLLSQTALSSKQSEYVRMFQRNCHRLVALINDFLDFSRIEAGAVRLERVPFRIPEPINDAVATFREAAARKGIALGVEIHPAAHGWALGDPLRIQQVLVNLLSNALKFTDAGRVDVSVKAPSGAAEGGQFRFEVRDTGPGIGLEDQHKIFGRFVQLPNQSNGQQGAGLGLTICHDLVELMGGAIGVVSQEGSGSAFYFNLPLETTEPVPANPEAAPDRAPDRAVTEPSWLPAGGPIRILVAEDTEDNRLLVEYYLHDQPVELRIALNGQEALDAIKRGEQFDLILMDIDMPVMDGYAATKQIRAWQQSSQGLQGQGTPTPIIALSADAMRDAVLASMEVGCVAHVAKPIDRAKLLETIRHFAPGKASQGAGAERTIAVSEQIKALVPQYLASQKRQIEEARASLASGDFGPIRRFGHNLKGTGRGYGFPPIEELGREIEQAATHAEASRVADQLQALHRFVSESATTLADS